MQDSAIYERLDNAYEDHDLVSFAGLVKELQKSTRKTCRETYVQVSKELGLARNMTNQSLWQREHRMHAKDYFKKHPLDKSRKTFKLLLRMFREDENEARECNREFFKYCKNN
jgi:hypothetical protein